MPQFPTSYGPSRYLLPALDPSVIHARSVSLESILERLMSNGCCYSECGIVSLWKNLQVVSRGKAEWLLGESSIQLLAAGQPITLDQGSLRQAPQWSTYSMRGDKWRGKEAGRKSTNTAVDSPLLS